MVRFMCSTWELKFAELELLQKSVIILQPSYYELTETGHILQDTVSKHFSNLFTKQYVMSQVYGALRSCDLGDMEKGDVIVFCASEDEVTVRCDLPVHQDLSTNVLL